MFLDAAMTVLFPFAFAYFSFCVVLQPQCTVFLEQIIWQILHKSQPLFEGSKLLKKFLLLWVVSCFTTTMYGFFQTNYLADFTEKPVLIWRVITPKKVHLCHWKRPTELFVTENVLLNCLSLKRHTELFVTENALLNCLSLTTPYWIV